ncbi:MAG: TIGR03435 family protein [Acidobacteriia bacterium]|nr:TIGR03435 family protein [Terriglobia bacterium]
MMLRTMAGVGWTVLLAGVLSGQATAPLTFEVATVKPSTGDDHRIGIQMLPGGGLRTTGTTLKFLLTFAYDVRDFQISGGPGWINSDRFDITAKAERGGSDSAPPDPRSMTDAQMKTAREQMQQRLQGLLAERFQLVIHRETKEQSVYALVVGKTGSKLKESQVTSGEGHRMMRMGRGQISGEGVPLEMLTNVLSNQLGRPVIDRTGLQGPFDLKLEWTPDPGQAGPFGGLPPPGVEVPPPPDPNGPSLFTAVQEQLGLRLESTKGPVQMIVIDKVEKPSEN